MSLWFAEANLAHRSEPGPPKWTAGPAEAGPWVVRRSGPVWPAEADQWDTCRAVRVRPFGHQTDLNCEESSQRLTDTVPEPIPRGL